MAATEAPPFWTWVIRGIGGALRIMEGLLEAECVPGESQLVLLEYQAARAVEAWRVACIKTDGLVPGNPRSTDQINLVRNFGPEQVLDDTSVEHWKDIVQQTDVTHA